MSVTIKLYDLDTNELADISDIALERSLQWTHNQSRCFTLQAPAGNSLLTDVAGDGYPNLRKGNRKLIVWEDFAPTQPIFHGRVFTIERVGDGNQNLVTVIAYDPLMELGYEADDRAGRVVRGSTTQPTAGDPFGEYDGNFINPLFASSVAAQDGISGPDLILQALTNSVNTGAETDPTPGEGPLPIKLATSTDWDLDVGPAIDLSPTLTMAWPKPVGDFIQQLCATGVCDIYLRPVDPTEGLDPYVMVEMHAVSDYGTDKSGTVHFHYWTGDKNAQACRHLEDFTTINNKLYKYLGPPEPGGTRWVGNITPGTAGTTIDPSASRTLYGGQFMQIEIDDTTGTESESRPLYLAEWNAEQGYRVEPRDLLYVTPSVVPLFNSLEDYEPGDKIGIETGGDFGVSLSATQRVYGFTKTWDRQGVARTSELLTSADVSLA